MKRTPDKGFFYTIPDPFDTVEQYEKYIGADLPGLSRPELMAERERVRFVLLIEPSPDAWFLKRLHAIEEAMRATN